MTRLELLVAQVNDDSYKKEWKDKLEEKLKGAGYNQDDDRPGIESFINFGVDILFKYKKRNSDHCCIPSEEEISYITEIVLALVSEWQVEEFLSGKLYAEQEKEIKRLLKVKMRKRIIESTSQDNN